MCQTFNFGHSAWRLAGACLLGAGALLCWWGVRHLTWVLVLRLEPHRLTVSLGAQLPMARASSVKARSGRLGHTAGP